MRSKAAIASRPRRQSPADFIITATESARGASRRTPRRYLARSSPFRFHLPFYLASRHLLLSYPDAEILEKIFDVQRDLLVAGYPEVLLRPVGRPDYY